MMKVPFGWAWGDSEALLDERLNDFTQHITRFPVLFGSAVKFLVDLYRDPDGQELVQIRFC